MKLPFFKSLLIAGALILAWNCSDTTAIPMGALSGTSENVRVIDIGPNENLYVAEDGTVYDSQWNVFGTYTEGNIVTNEGETFLTGVDLNERPLAKIVETNGGTKMVEFDDGTVTDIQGNNIGNVDDNGNVVNDNGEVIAENPNKPTETSSAGGTNPTSAATNPGGNGPVTTSSNSNGGNNNTTTSSAATQQGGQCDGQCYDAPSGKCVAYYAEQIGPKGEKYAYDKTCNLNCYYDPSNKSCKEMGGSAAPSSNGSQTNSSSSKAKSSSSKNNTTQSSASQQTGGCPNIVAKGSTSGSGFASRYWDCCKPSCSWKENTNNLASQCSNKGTTKSTDWGAASVCDGGSMSTCISQIPFTISGCDNIGFAYAAVPTNNACGRCFELSFTGTGKYETKLNHQKLKGKKLIVMASNIGYDVEGHQFDIMIPGGGYGKFNGCSNMGWSSNMGQQYGGLLSDCESEAGYSGGDDQIYKRRKECLVNKCNSSFGSDTQAKQGCLFLANFMEAAGNPNHTYREVECPSVLTAKY
jgi:hypothetical protein